MNSNPSEEIKTLETSRFWKTQPVGVCNKLKESPGVIIDQQEIPDSIDLPYGLEWREVSVMDDIQITNLEKFLNQNYIEGPQFRLIYSTQFLKHFISLGKPGMSIMLCKKDSDEILGCITAVFRKVLIMGETHNIAEANLLCIHKDHRGQYYTEMIVREITRRVNTHGVHIAIFTSATPLPQKNIGMVKYFHKFLDIAKLNSVRYTEFDKDDIPKAIMYHEHKPVKKVVNRIAFHILRPSHPDDFPTIERIFAEEYHMSLINEIIDVEKLQELQSSSYVQNFTIEEVNMIGKKRKIVGFISIYEIKLGVIGTDETLDTCYILYHCGCAVHACLNDLFTLLKKQGISVVNCINMGKNKDIIRFNDMLPGTGSLYYYMYNYKLPVLHSDDIFYMVY